MSSRPSEPSSVTRILERLAEHPNDESQHNALYSAVYDELRRTADAFMRRERRGHTLSPTALVNEAYLKMVGHGEFESRAHFFGSAARAMRQILVSYAQSRSRRKRAGGWERVTFSDVGDEKSMWEFETIALNTALSQYAELDERSAKVAELRIFGGLTGDEIASLLGVSRRTVTNDWHVARRWLSLELGTVNGP